MSVNEKPLDRIKIIDLLARLDEATAAGSARSSDIRDYVRCLDSSRAAVPDMQSSSPELLALEYELAQIAAEAHLPAPVVNGPEKKEIVLPETPNESGSGRRMRGVLFGAPAKWLELSIPAALASVIFAGLASLHGNGMYKSYMAAILPLSDPEQSNTVLVPKTGIISILRAKDGTSFGPVDNEYSPPANVVRSTPQPPDGALLVDNRTGIGDVPKAKAPNEDLALSSGEDLLHWADDQLKNGNIDGARAAYEEMAARGSAKGALGLAQTYDPVCMQQIQGCTPDSHSASLWYERAAKLGSSEAAQHLKQLETMSSGSDVLRR